MDLVAKKLFFTKGVGRDTTPLGAFEQALRDAGIQQFNLIKVSSIIPPHCKIVSKERGLKELRSGAVTFVILSRLESNEPNRLIAASIGAAIPKNRSMYGYLSEYEAFGESDEVAGMKAEEIAANMLASTLGIDFKAEENWEKKKEIIKMSNKVVKTTNITQSAIVGKDGKRTCVIAAAVLILK